MIFIFILIPLVLGSITNVILPELDIVIIPPIAPIITLIASAAVVYAIVKYKLMTLTPAYAADDILSTMADSLILIDPEGKVTEINNSALNLLGYKREEIIGKSMDMLFLDTNVLHPAINDLLKDKKLVDREIFFKTKYGREVPILLSGSLIENTSMQQLGIVCIAHDITKCKETENKLLSFNKKLQQSNQELQDFAYVASHDLQEPLRKINTFGESLKQKYYSILEEQGRDYLDRMQNAAVRMQILINDLIAYSRVTTKAESYITLDLSQIIKEVLSDLEIRIEKTSAKVEVSSFPQSMLIRHR